MKRLLYTILFLLGSMPVFGQHYDLVYRSSDAGIELKWYAQDLVYRKEYFIMRRENGGSWEQLNQTAITTGSYRFTTTELEADKELADYKSIALTTKKLEGFGLLLAMLKSFESTPYSKFLGIYYFDATAAANTTYDYRLMERKNGQLVELGMLSGVNRSEALDKRPVDSLSYETIKRGVHFRWKHEATRFYGVNIYRSGAPDSLGQLITKEPILLSKVKNEEGNMVLPDHFYADERLNEKQTYYYTFVGLNFFGDELTHSQPLKVRIKDETPPIPPTGIDKQIYDKKIVLTWTQPESSDDMAGYHIYASAANDSVLERISAQPVAIGTMRYEFEVGRYALYTLRVAAVDQEENEAFSEEVYAETIDKIAPAAPELVMIVPDTGRLIVQWQPNSESDLMGYKIYRSVKGNVGAMSLLTADHFSDASFTDSLPANAINDFSYAVIALDSSGNESKLSAIATNKMIDATPPKAPFLKTVNVMNEKEALLTWVRNTELDHQGYAVYRKNDSDSLDQFKRINLQVLPGDVTQFTDRSIDGKNTYSYYVEAVDQQGNVSAPSNIVRFRIAPKKAENNLKVTLKKAKYNKATGSIRLSWKPGTYSETTRYVVFRKNASGTFVPISAMLELPAFTDDSFEKQPTIEYQVRIYDNGQTQKSEPIRVTIPMKKTR